MIMDDKIRKKVFSSTDYRTLTDAGKTVFRNVVDALDDRGLLKVEDTPVIASYSRNVVLARTAARDIEKMGTVLEYTERGFLHYKENPAVNIMNKAQNAYESTAIKLGLTPTGRRRMKGEEIRKEKTALEMFEEESDA